MQIRTVIAVLLILLGLFGLGWVVLTSDRSAAPDLYVWCVLVVFGLQVVVGTLSLIAMRRTRRAS